MSGNWRVLAAVVVAVVVAGCGGAENSLTQDQGPSGEAGESPPEHTGGIAGDAFDDVDLDDPEFQAALRSFYDEFLFSSDLHRTPDEGVAEYGSGLAEVATPAVVAEADAWRAANEAHGSGFQRVESLFSVANVTDIALEGDRVTIEDCTAETATMITGQDIEAYVTRSSQVLYDAGRYRVVDTDVVHEGQIGSPGYGCVPDPMAEEATATAEAVLEGFRAAQGDPRSGMADSLAAVVADPLESELAASLADQASEGASFTSPTEVALAVEGIDPRGLGLVVVVSACVSYPEGLVQRELSSGEAVREVFPAGTRQEVVLAVRMNDVDGPAAFSIVSEKVPATC